MSACILCLSTKKKSQMASPCEYCNNCICIECLLELESTTMCEDKNCPCIHYKCPQCKCSENFKKALNEDRIMKNPKYLLQLLKISRSSYHDECISFNNLYEDYKKVKKNRKEDLVIPLVMKKIKSYI